MLTLKPIQRVLAFTLSSVSVLAWCSLFASWSSGFPASRGPLRRPPRQRKKQLKDYSEEEEEDEESDEEEEEDAGGLESSIRHSTTEIPMSNHLITPDGTLSRNVFTSAEELERAQRLEERERIIREIWRNGQPDILGTGTGTIGRVHYY
ncbi:hypothetical protein H4Q32_017385 [Labeo rohita]|uniref:EVA1 domain-containing protein n=1 Tax=Labeo rohita TaxID=84645 RepID=A0ABQ8LXQ8_LABRO|nr:hypothetical protein H4Q32_017385 [Labeo rohita]